MGVLLNVEPPVFHANAGYERVTKYGPPQKIRSYGFIAMVWSSSKESGLVIPADNKNASDCISHDFIRVHIRLCRLIKQAETHIIIRFLWEKKKGKERLGSRTSKETFYVPASSSFSSSYVSSAAGAASAAAGAVATAEASGFSRYSLI